MAGEVLAGLSAFKMMFDIAKSLKDMNDTVKRNAAVADLWEQIISAQTRYAAAVEEIGHLEKELTRFKTWEAEKQRYKLTEVGHGMTTYTLKEGMENGEPAHHLCASCYNNGHKSVLQTETRNPGRCEVMVCHRCGSDLYIHGARIPEHNAMKRSPKL
jgi:hypothetical protein